MESNIKAFLKKIKTKIDSERFEVWFQFVHPKSFENNIFNLEVPNNFYKDWIKNNFYEDIKECAEDVFGKNIDIKFIINPDSFKVNVEQSVEMIKPVKIKGRTSSKTKSFKFKQPNNKYTFNRFVVGSNNQFAHAACKAIAKNPGTAYNPLFLYGAVGLGKTHLMHAISNQILQKNPNASVCYISSEQFVNDLINSLQHKRIANFRNSYRTADVLLVDDIQFISGKDRTQEEFFHTFNTLYEEHKQIVISSDKFPKEMDGLEERLKSRFECGLIADIQPPDLETKVAILQQKAKENNTELPSDVSLYIAGKIRSNVRELEGCLARICAFSSLTGSQITLTLAKEVLKDLFIDSEKPVDIKTIQESVADFFNIKVMDLKSKRRDRKLVVPRQIAMYLCRRLTNTSLPQIGKNFGGRDHTTVLHSYSKIHKIVTQNTDSEIYGSIVKISKKLNCDLTC